MSTVVIDISPGDIQVISDSPPVNLLPKNNMGVVPMDQPELSISEDRPGIPDSPPLSQGEIEEIHNKYKM